MAMGPSGVRCQEWPCWLVAGNKLLLCSALFERISQEDVVQGSYVIDVLNLENVINVCVA
jgi:hypothetical protein